MGQLQGLMSSPASPRVPFDENGENGLIIGGKYLPEELLSEILFHVDYRTLLNCQLVCKRWYSILREYVWRKKAESVVGMSFHFDDEQAWYRYYIICSKKFARKNLLKNHSGKSGRKRHWKILSEGGDEWAVECPPIGSPPLPISEPVFEGEQYCFVTSYYSCSKEQTVDLVAEGLSPKILDEIQPPITISEWYCARIDCPAIYECFARLTDSNGKNLDTFQFRDTLRDDKQNIWLYVEHEFVNYGPGVRKVIFYHGGMDQNMWSGHYGSKMAGACVKVDLYKQKSTQVKGAPKSVHGSNNGDVLRFEY